METIKVNMSPNPLDVQTIHASQNDGEARQWGFELHNNGDVIDASEISDQLVFKAYKGGTEQLLPENGSTPTTSPFLGDIKYPQGLLSDQEFLYRESPTEEDGLAKITDIKGNTLVWNQLVQNGNFADGLTNWAQANATLSVSNGVCRATLTGDAWNNDIRQTMTIVNGHKYLLSFDYLTSTDLRELTFTTFGNITAIDFRFSSSTTKKHHSAIYTATADYTGIVRFTMRSDGSSMSGQYYEVSNVNLFDLTQMFGAGNEPTTTEEFTSLFSLPYYDFNQGSLLSFNGNGIKTVGKNQYNNAIGLRNLYLNQNTGLLGNGGTTYAAGLLTNKQYTLSGTRGNRSLIGFSKKQASELGNGDTIENISSVSLPYTFNSSDYHSVVYYSNTEYVATLGTDVQLEFGSVASDFEPYTSSTLSLPISTYFPNGMDGVGTDYDELTESKAHHRMARADLGSLIWTRRASSEGYVFVSGVIADMRPTGNVTTANVLLPSYTLNMTGTGYSMPNDKTYRVGGTYFGTQRVIIRDDSYTDATAFTTAMSGVYLVFPLATPTETSFTTASLVTENAEIPLSNNDGDLIGKCTEELSAEPGFHDAKIKLSDSDGTCYSNKLQLHVERSPQ